MSIKKYIPAPLKVLVKQSMRKVLDILKGQHWKLAKRKDLQSTFAFQFGITQTIMPGLYFNNKLHNILRGANAIHSLVIQPGEVFSFWHMLGKPTAKNGYQLSRNIIAGKVGEDYGGGLCQLASILYLLGLHMGLEIQERYHHSVDIYQEQDRFTPLGADAAVVYGYKDLRFKNPYSFPIRLRAEIIENKLICSLDAANKIIPRNIYFEREELANSRKVKTIWDNGHERHELSDVIYQIV